MSDAQKFHAVLFPALALPTRERYRLAFLIAESLGFDLNKSGAAPIDPADESAGLERRQSDDPSLLRALANDKATTGRRIAAARKAAGLSQEKLAEVLECHVVTVSKLETGVMDLTMEWILRFADALCVPVTRFTEDRDIIHDPKGYVQGVLERHKIKPGTLAKNIGMAGSTFTRAFNDQNHKFLFSAKTLRKIKEWDQTQ